MCAACGTIPTVKKCINIYSLNKMIKSVRWDGNIRTEFNPLTPNDLWKRRAVSPLKIKIPSKNTREKPTTIPIIHSID
jgi:hypothetical protein